MVRLSSSLCVLLVLVSGAVPQSVNTERPQEIHPQTTQSKPRKTDPAQLQADARELAALSASVSADVDQVNKGMMPKDLSDKLKRIEHLSKKLRNELVLR